MINFYNTTFLWLLPVSLFPVIIHLLSFKKNKIIKFSYTFLIEKIVNESSIKRKIVDIIILILRCLIIFFLIIFIARPVFFYNPKENKNINLIVAIDNSFSTKQKLINRTKLDLFLTGLDKVLKNLQNKRTKIHIITFNENVSQVNKNFDFIDELNYDKNDIKYAYRNTNLDSVINYSINLFNNYGKTSQNKVLIFTDLAQHIFSGEKESGIFLDNKYNIDFLFCYPYISINNNYFKNVDISLYEKLLNINFEPVNDKKNLPFSAQFYLENKLVDFVNIDLSKEKYGFNYVIENNVKEIFGHLTLSQDSLNEDNNFYFVKNLSDDIEIGCFINEPIYYRGINSVKYYLDKLLISGFSFKTFNYETVLENNFYSKEIGSKYDNIICINVPNIDNLGLKKSKEKKIIFFLSENINYDEYEQFFEDIEFVDIEENRFSKFNLVLGDDKEFNDFVSLFDFVNIKVNKKYRLTLKNKNSHWKILLKFNDGTPALISDGKIFLFPFSLSKEWSNLIHKPFFVSMIKKVFSNINEEKKNIKDYYYISDIISIKNVNTVYDVLLQKKLQNESEFEIINDGIKFYKPGIYSVASSDSDKSYKIGINIFPQESDTRIIDKEKIKQYFKNVNNVTISYSNMLKNNYENEIFKWCFGKEYSDEIFFIIVIMFMLEMFLSRIGRRKI
ncbi:MAG: vWA domain-containing protein [Endomicrobiia bacterium]